MPFVSGTFSPLYNWSEDRDNGLDILADRHTANDQDMAAAITLALRKDGANVPTQNLPMGGRRHTGAGAAVNPNDYVIKQQLDDALSPGVSNIGDYLTTERNPGANWLRRDGAIHTKAAYPALSTLLGTKYAKFGGFDSTGYSLGVATAVSSMAYGAGLFVVGGPGGMIRTSPTGLTGTWTARTTGVTDEISGLAFANGIFVAVGSNGRILTSPDLITWTSRTSGVTDTLMSAAFGGGRWIVVGFNGRILMSPDNGVSWVTRSITGGFTEPIGGVAYGNGRFVAVGGNPGQSIVSIDNGDTFTRSSTGILAGGHTSVAFGKGIFVANGPVGTNTVYVSATGTGAWQVYGCPAAVQRIVFGLNNFIGVGSNGTTSSIDGIRWDTHSAISGLFFGLAVGPDYALAGSTTPTIARSVYALNTATQFQVPADDASLGWIKAL